MSVEKIVIRDLDQFAASSLIDELEKHGIQAAMEEQPSKSFGEPISIAVTIAIAVGAPLAIGIAGWLMSGGKEDKFDFIFEEVHTDGTVVHQEFHYTGKVKNETDPELIDALGEALPKHIPGAG